MKHLFLKKITKFAIAFVLFGIISCSDDDSSSTSKWWGWKYYGRCRIFQIRIKNA